MERETVQQLFRQHYAKMQRVARTLLYDVQESEDVVSDIFEQLLHGRITLIPGAEERYLLTSVRNRCLKRLRHIDIIRSAAAGLCDDGSAEDAKSPPAQILERFRKSLLVMLIMSNTLSKDDDKAVYMLLDLQTFRKLHVNIASRRHGKRLHEPSRINGEH